MFATVVAPPHSEDERTQQAIAKAADRSAVLRIVQATPATQVWHRQLARAIAAAEARRFDAALLGELLQPEGELHARARRGGMGRRHQGLLELAVP